MPFLSTDRSSSYLGFLPLVGRDRGYDGSMNDPIMVIVDADIAALVPGFLANRRREVDTLLTLVAQNDFPKIRLIGHSMKGSGGGYGFDLISLFGDEIEVAALNADAGAVRQIVRRFSDYLSRIRVVWA